jgi:hypothetical protein
MRLFFGALAALCLAATLSATTTVTKVYTNDQDGNPVYAEITNTGTINATNRLTTNDRLDIAAKTNAIDGVLTGAANAGMLVKTTLVPGDAFFATDPVTNEIIVVTYDGLYFSLPNGSTGIAKWLIPGGIR